jgi:hypothetical protein
MMKKRVAANPERVKKISGVFQLNITKDCATVATWSMYPNPPYDKDIIIVNMQYLSVSNFLYLTLGPETSYPD